MGADRGHLMRDPWSGGFKYCVRLPFWPFESTMEIYSKQSERAIEIFVWNYSYFGQNNNGFVVLLLNRYFKWVSRSMC